MQPAYASYQSTRAVSDRVVQFFFDQFTSLPVLDHIAAQDD